MLSSEGVRVVHLCMCGTRPPSRLQKAVQTEVLHVCGVRSFPCTCPFIFTPFVSSVCPSLPLHTRIPLLIWQVVCPRAHSQSLQLPPLCTFYTIDAWNKSRQAVELALDCIEHIWNAYKDREKTKQERRIRPELMHHPGSLTPLTLVVGWSLSACIGRDAGCTLDSTPVYLTEIFWKWKGIMILSTLTHAKEDV